MDDDGGNIRQLTQDGEGGAAFARSPDGTRIAFASDTDNGSDIYVMDTDRGNLRRLTDDPGWDFHPAWSPDSMHVVFASLRDGQVVIYSVVGITAKTY